MGQNLDGFENHETISFELNKKFITPIINSKKSKALEKLRHINDKQEKKDFYILVAIYFTMLASGSLLLETIETLTHFKNFTFLDFLKEDENLKEQNPSLMFLFIFGGAIASFLLKMKSKESEEVKKLREVKKQELSDQGLNMSFQNQKDLKLFFKITKEEKLIQKWLLQEINNLKEDNKEELKKKIFDSFDNDDFILFINTIQEIASFKLEKNISFSMPQEIGIVLKLNMDYLEDEKTQ